MTNPLLHAYELPPFSKIKAEHIYPAIKEIIESNLNNIDLTLSKNTQPSWDNTIAPIEHFNDQLEQSWSPVSHLNGVLQTDELRDSYEKCLPLLSNYSTQLGQNKQLFAAYQAIKNGQEYSTLSQAQQQIINNTLRDFKLSGIDLNKNQQQRYADIKARQSELSNLFSNNVLDATQAWSKHLIDASELAGLPATALNAAKSAAEKRDLTAYVLTLDAPCYLAVMSYADSQALRREMYIAFTSRASELGPNASEFDNSTLMVEITQLRHELATLLGFSNYSEYSLATKMASSTEKVVEFLQQLAQRSRPIAVQELATLRKFAQQEYGVSQLNAWDISYYTEKLRQQSHNLDQEKLRPYFPVSKVTAGLFTVTGRLFDIEISEDKSIETWHNDVRAFNISRNGHVIARFYLDLFARENKRGGAWMADCRVRRTLNDQQIQLPVAFLTCNFMAPAGGQPSLLTFNEVTTLFHEFGHGLHHMLTQVNFAEVSGINGVAWDAVELPSQFLENWCWQTDVIAEISAHFQTNAPLPKELLDSLLAAKNFQAGMQMLRQIEFALFDFLMHKEPGMKSADHIQQILNEVRQQVAVFDTPEENRFQHGFSHIFAGGYSAGYYSYKWAEVLSADAFSVFEDNGIYHDETRRRFLKEILEQGGSSDAMTLFENFMGREPNINALLRHSGIV